MKTEKIVHHRSFAGSFSMRCKVNINLCRTFQILWIYLLLERSDEHEKENRNNVNIDFSNRNIHSLYIRIKSK